MQCMIFSSDVSRHRKFKIDIAIVSFLPNKTFQREFPKFTL